MVKCMEEDNMSTREQVLRRVDEASRIEKEIAQLKEILDLNSIGMDEPVIDADGYPRNDIDVYMVRHTRHKIICLQNDHKQLMSEIEAGLHSVHSQFREGIEQGTSDTSGTPSVNYTPIARVSVVHPHSPAHQAGLEEEDLVVQFGSVNSTNFGCLKDIATVVEHSVNETVRLTVRRRGRTVRLGLTPKPWQGRGLLGCLILPMEESVDR